MNNLRINGTLDSREVAEMIGKRHDHLMRDIDNYVRYISELGIPNYGVSSGGHKIVATDFFIASSYVSEQNKKIPCYLITRKGCEMVANKLTGAKGVQFTAQYVHLFHEMEKVQRGIASDTSDKLLRAEAMLLNAKTRQYKAIMEAYGDTSGLDPASVRAYSLRTAETVYDMDMGDLLPTSEKTYSATEIGQMLGGIHSTTIGKKAGELGLKTPDYSIIVRDVAPGHNKPVDCYRYNQRALEKIRAYYGYDTDGASTLGME